MRIVVAYPGPGGRRRFFFGARALSIARSARFIPAARRECVAHPKADFRRSSAGSIRVASFRSAVALPVGATSNASSSESRPCANARMCLFITFRDVYFIVRSGRMQSNRFLIGKMDTLKHAHFAPKKFDVVDCSRPVALARVAVSQQFYEWLGAAVFSIEGVPRPALTLISTVTTNPSFPS
jgi:hypothetical protein